MNLSILKSIYKYREDIIFEITKFTHFTTQL